MLSFLPSNPSLRLANPSEPSGLQKDVASITGRQLVLIAPRHTNTLLPQHPGAPGAHEALAVPEADPSHPQHHLDVAEEAAAEAEDGPGTRLLMPDGTKETSPATTVSPTTHVARLRTRRSGHGPPAEQSNEEEKSTRSLRQCRYCYKCVTECMCSSFYESSRNKEYVTYKRALFSTHVGRRYLDNATVSKRLRCQQREPCQDFPSYPSQSAISRGESPGSQNNGLRVQAVIHDMTTSFLRNNSLHQSGLNSDDIAGRNYVSSRQSDHTTGPQTPEFDKVLLQVISSKEKGGGVYAPFWTKGPSQYIKVFYLKNANGCNSIMHN